MDKRWIVYTRCTLKCSNYVPASSRLVKYANAVLNLKQAELIFVDVFSGHEQT